MLLGFSKQFWGLVEAGAKETSLRAQRKDGRVAKIGETMHLYGGLRTKQVRKLGEGVCYFSEPAEIRIHVQKVLKEHPSYDPERCKVIKVISSLDVRIGKYWLDGDRIDRLAKADGFDGVRAFAEFFLKAHGERFLGRLYAWKLRENGGAKIMEVFGAEVLEALNKTDEVVFG